MRVLNEGKNNQCFIFQVCQWHQSLQSLLCSLDGKVEVTSTYVFHTQCTVVKAVYDFAVA